MPRPAWVFLLGAVALQACLCVFASPSDNEATGSFRVAVIDPVTKRADGAEERGQPYTENVVDKLYNEIVKSTVLNKRFFTLKVFHDWYDEVMKYCIPGKGPAQMVGTLTRLFGVNAFQRAMNYGKLNGGGVKILSLENAQLEYWMGEGMTAYALYRLLRLNKPPKDLPWDIWKKYVVKRYPDKDPYVVLIAEAYGSCDDKTFADFIMKMWMTNRRKNAEVAIDAKLVTWQREGLSEQDVYKLLKLDKSDAPLSSRSLSMWIFYTQRLRLDMNDKLFSHLQERYKKEADLANAVIAYEIVGGGHIEGTLTENLLKHWAKSGKSNEDVALLISLDQPEHRNYKLEMVKSFSLLQRDALTSNL